MIIADEIRKKARQQGIVQGLERGIEQGFKRGRQQRNREIARNLLAQGLDLTMIKNITGLSDEAINKIKLSQH